MKRTISYIFTTLLLGWLMVYYGYLMNLQAIYVTDNLAGNEMLVAWWLIVLLLVTWFYLTIGWARLSKPKITLSVLGLIILFTGAYLFVDAPNTNTFLSDLTRVIGVYVLIAGLAWFGWHISGDEKNTGTGSAAHRIKDAEVIEI